MGELIEKNTLSFFAASSEQQIKSVYDYNIDAFTDPPGFDWTVLEIKKQIKDGWDLYAVELNSEVIAAVFLKVDPEGLKTKNTSLKMHLKGSGYNHQIKDFFEFKARELKEKRIYHYCRIDNFRMYSLNESHGYKRTQRSQVDPHVVEWLKELE
ncbi:MAG: hypothetical protein ACO20H_02290 [Bacteriovoracaceae bacterium]